MKKTYRIRVHEEYTTFVDVDAECGQEAIAEIEEQIESGELVVPSDLSAEISRRVSVVRIVNHEL